MKRIIGGLAAAVCLVVSTVANAASDQGAVKKTILDLVAKSNKGDAAGAGALFSESASVIDEFAPYSWSGIGAWSKALGAYDTENGIEGSITKILKIPHINVEGTHAYAVVSVLYSFKERGKHRKESATEVLTLDKTETGWKIDSFAWLGRSGADQGADADAIVAAANTFAQSATASPPPAVIVDEFAPYHWVGEHAQDDWGSALTAMMTKTGGSDLALKLDAPSQLSINGGAAYAVFPTTITSKAHGKPEVEKGGFAMAFAKDGGWHIVSWSWATK